MYKAEAISEVGERHSYLNLVELKYRKNPDIQRTLADLTAAIELVKHRLLIGRGKLTSTDIRVLTKKLKERVEQENELRNQKQQVKMLIDSL